MELGLESLRKKNFMIVCGEIERDKRKDLEGKEKLVVWLKNKLIILPLKMRIFTVIPLVVLNSPFYRVEKININIICCAICFEWRIRVYIV